MVEADLYVAESKAWTDGSNFHPQRVAFEADSLLRSAELHDNELVLRWTDGVSGVVQVAELERRIQGDPLHAHARVPWARGKEWTVADWADVSTDDEALRSAMAALMSDGVLLVSGMDPEAGSAVALADRLGGMERSHLGESFRIHYSDDSRHIGEEMGEIPLHIDLVYRQRPPDFQVLHALRQIDGGGENVFVDIEHIERLLTDGARDLLEEVVLDFVATSSAVSFRGSHPVLHEDHDGRLRVAYNQYKVQFPVDTPPDYFEVFDQFRELIHRDDVTVDFLLPQDAAVVFDNRRVLHGRRAFSDARRDVIGCFASGDDIRNNLRVLEQRAGGGAA